MFTILHAVKIHALMYEPVVYISRRTVLVIARAAAIGNRDGWSWPIPTILNDCVRARQIDQLRKHLRVVLSAASINLQGCAYSESNIQ